MEAFANGGIGGAVIIRSSVELRRQARAALWRVQPWVAASGFVVGALVLLVGLASFTVQSGFSDVMRQVALELTATAFGAGMAFYVFQLHVGTFIVRSLVRSAPTATTTQFASEIADLPLLPDDSAAAMLGQSLARDVLAPGISSQIVAVTDASSLPRTFLDSLTKELAREGFLSVPVTASDLESHPTINEAAQGRLAAMLLAEDRNPQHAQRLWMSLRKSGRGVLVLGDLDRLALLDSPARRRSRVTNVLEDLEASGTAFVGIVTTEVWSGVEGVSAVRIPEPTQQELHDYLVALFEHIPEQLGAPLSQAVDRAADRARSDPYVLRLAVDLLTRPPDEASTWAIEALQRPGRIGYEAATLAQVLRSNAAELTAEAVASLRAIGRASLLSAREASTWSELTRNLDEAALDAFVIGLTELEKAGVIETFTDSGQYVVRTRHPVWLSFALGLEALPERMGIWNVALRRSDASTFTHGYSFAIAAMATTLGASTTPVQALHRAGFDRLPPSLRLLTAAYEGLLAVHDGQSLDAVIVSELARCWPHANDVDKLEFLDVLDGRMAPRTLTFLWRKLTEAAPQRNSRRVRHRICRVLGEAGDTTWDALNQGWSDLVATSLTGDLSAENRTGPDTLDHGDQLDHVMWILPTLLERSGPTTMQAVAAMLDTLTVALHPPFEGYRRVGGRAPDIGLEISLAEGFKFAAASGVISTPEALWVRIRRMQDLMAQARSWYSRIAYVHAIALSVKDTGAGVDELRFQLDALGIDQTAHPLVREAVGLLMASTKAGWPAVLANLWSDEVETLTSCGEGLSRKAHKLLSTSALLANFAEEIAVQSDWSEGSIRQPQLLQQRREKAFLSNGLPVCLASTGRRFGGLHERPCACEFKLCGRPTAGIEGPRQFSPGFLRRSATATTRHAAYYPWRAWTNVFGGSTATWLKLAALAERGHDREASGSVPVQRRAHHHTAEREPVEAPTA